MVDTLEDTTVEGEVKEKKVYAPYVKPRASNSSPAGFSAPKTMQILEMTVSGYTQEEIANAVKLTKNSVKKVQHDYRKTFKGLEKVKTFREVRADLLAAAQLSALETVVDPKKLAKTSSVGAAKIFDVMHKAERLENDQSTENHAHLHIGRVTLSEK